ncbi:hypothetical protein B0A61_12955 [Flavobacterium aquatile LMG 4008 = ATCC 11947]|uniref:Uncharacterized protein n=2 Tax=Flavobacterium aquatile TaxID=245 RepID=A0A095SXD6_9FLAO|nr:hypothetical protein LG45_00930 [Flavobacterium aquatile LMG 4008 = ATCC 11947]OXA66174.1 hypothetical protein B0A61_12955 [Flavobacterium aquatile LMG 4008 = ATCC 11947]
MSILSCKNTENEKKAEIATETKKDSIVEEKMTITQISDTLKKSDYSKEFAKYSDEIINKISENMTYVLTKEETARANDEEYLKEITSFKDNIISLYWETCGTGGCVQHQKLQIKNNDLIDLGNGYEKLTESESKKLDSEIKSKIKNYSYISGRNENEISITKNGNYLIGIRGLTDEDGEATGGTIEISYETKDLKTYIPSTLKITKIN